jgi:DNA modification methylase
MEGDLVCDPFAGGGVTAYVSERLGRCWIAGDLNDCTAAKQRLLELKNGTHPEWSSTRKRMTASAGTPESPTLSLF